MLQDDNFQQPCAIGFEQILFIFIFSRSCTNGNWTKFPPLLFVRGVAPTNNGNGELLAANLTRALQGFCPDCDSDSPVAW